MVEIERFFFFFQFITITSSAISIPITDSLVFILVELRLLLEFLPYNLVGVEAMALSFIKTLA